jgi:hypothetical protein
MASKESFEMMMIPKWLDAGHIPIENRAGAEEIPMEASIGRSYGKSRINRRENQCEYIFNNTDTNYRYH